MHIQSHLMSGWCAANCFSLTARERFLAMLAATLPDLDGLSWFFGAKAYWATHHIYGHNLLFGIALSGFLSVFCTHRLKCFLLYLGLFHLHLGMDLLGSGDGWTIPYALPFSSHEYAFHGTWDFNGPENKLVGLGLLIWCLGIAVVQRRTPLEYPMPKLDAQLVALAARVAAYCHRILAVIPRKSPPPRESKHRIVLPLTYGQFQCWRFFYMGIGLCFMIFGLAPLFCWLIFADRQRMPEGYIPGIALLLVIVFILIVGGGCCYAERWLPRILRGGCPACHNGRRMAKYFDGPFWRWVAQHGECPHCACQFYFLPSRKTRSTAKDIHDEDAF